MQSVIIHWQTIAALYALWARQSRDDVSAIYYQGVSASFATSAREALINGS